MFSVYYLKGQAIQKISRYRTWEDAYLSIYKYADKNGYALCPDGANKNETNQFIKILKNL